MNYYNENDPKPAQWLRELIKEGIIPAGDVDDRSIADVSYRDIKDYTQCHFFAGIGGWSYALELAGWLPSNPVWTGSCPCQPFSISGNKKGTDDARHLWPEFERLIRAGNPAIVFGEQVASPLGRDWLARIQTDLEALGYETAAADLCAASVGAPHIRQRLWWVAESHGWNPGSKRVQRGKKQRQLKKDSGITGRLRNTNRPGPQRRRVLSECTNQLSAWAASLGNWIPCTDGKKRRIKPGIEPLVNGLPGRMGLLRGYGNAIVPQVAQAFIESYLSTYEKGTS